MKENFFIKEYRGSIFLTQEIPSESNLIKELAELLNIKNPTIVEKTPKDTNGADISSLKEWNFISSSNQFQISFQSQKIDFEQRLDVSYSEKSLSSFCELCVSVFKKILDYKPQAIIRLAIAPTLKYNGDFEILVSKINSFFSKNDFLGCRNEKLDFSQVYRHVEVIGNKRVKINYFARFFINNNIQIEGGKLNLYDEILLNFDINTFVGNKYVFTNEDIKDFFMKSSNFSSRFIDYFFADKNE